jgi:hypothetical protein
VFPGSIAQAVPVVLSGSRKVSLVGGKIQAQSDSTCRHLSRFRTQVGGVIVRMPAFDLVCGCTIKPFSVGAGN